MAIHNPDDDDHTRRNPDDDHDRSPPNADATPDEDTGSDTGGPAAIEYEHSEDAVEGVTIYNPDAVGKDGGEWITARSISRDRDQIC